MGFNFRLHDGRSYICQKGEGLTLIKSSLFYTSIHVFLIPVCSPLKDGRLRIRKFEHSHYLLLLLLSIFPFFFCFSLVGGTLIFLENEVFFRNKHKNTPTHQKPQIKKNPPP
jgi:hypothetical protein